MDAPELQDMEAISQLQFSPSIILPSTIASVYTGGQSDEFLRPQMAREDLGQVDTVDILSYGMDFSFPTDDVLFGDKDWSFPPPQEIGTGVDAVPSPPLSLSAETSRPSWRGSCEISVSKRSSLEQEVQSVFAQVGYHKSRVTMS